MMNLFVAIILTNYTISFERNLRPDGVKRTLDDESFDDYNACWNELYVEYVQGLKALVREASASSSSATRAKGLVEAALKNPQSLPAAYFAKLLLRLKAPLGFRKRSAKAGVFFTAGHVMRWIKHYQVPIVEGKINFYTTLHALIDINVLEGEVPTGLKKFLSHKLSGHRLERLHVSSQNLDEDNNESIAEVLAREQVNATIRSYVMRWRMRRLKRQGASKEVMRNFVQDNVVRAFERELEATAARRSPEARRSGFLAATSPTANSASFQSLRSPEPILESDSESLDELLPSLPAPPSLSAPPHAPPRSPPNTPPQGPPPSPQAKEHAGAGWPPRHRTSETAASRGAPREAPAATAA
eukprot:CAMPEP_0202060286 /NCGR_PEP_ID=MMETSP0963-20130614/37803_1 /ASSEMBLY_ACC=CAM_ASM_000494 /TAXON_ID=4773 /ORGANISM="Schizochytrium aggregatum, Strain ATCC28209" /LENGTH=356 /DNA_ID=CAMNT_0048626397 /DNA_START=32 /DNA_END=1098 /DNA_ORIENTATION=+